MYFKDKPKENLEEQEARDRKVLIIGVVAGVGTLLAGWLLWSLFFSGQFGTFTDNTYHISIKYPRNWSVNRGYEGTLVTFASPKEDSLDTFIESFNIAVKDLSEQPMTLDEYSKLATKQMAAVFKNQIQVVESQPITFAGQSAYRYVVRAPVPDDLTLTVIWFIKDNQAYNLTSLRQGLREEKYKPLFDEMLRSFSIQ